MDNIINNVTANSLNKYFNILSKYGYKDNKSTERMVLLSLYDDILTGEFREFVTNEDYKKITNALYCLFDGCLIEFPEYKIYDTVIRRFYDGLRYRKSEDNIIRKSQRNSVREEC